MRGLFFLIAFVTAPTFSQSLPENSEESNQKIKLVRAVDDRAKIIRQRRDLVDVEEQAQIHSETSVVNE